MCVFIFIYFIFCLFICRDMQPAKKRVCKETCITPVMYTNSWSFTHSARALYLHPPAEDKWWTRHFSQVTSLTIPAGITNVLSDAFTNCENLKCIILPTTLTQIGRNAFQGCIDLTFLTLSEGLLIIGDFAFCGCVRLTSITLPNSLREISHDVFRKCKRLTSITLPDTITSIGSYAFYQCIGLTTLRLPNMLISIGRGAFAECTGLTSVTVPHTCIKFGDKAFEYCTSLRRKSVVFRPPANRASFIAWAVGKMRNRNNWQITTVKRLRNVLRLITELSYECHDVYEATMDPDGNNRVFGDFDNPVYEFILTFQNGELVCNYDDIW